MHQDGFCSGWPELTERLFFTQVKGFWFVDYFGEGETYLTELFQLLARPELAETLRWLSLRSPDVGANGTREWDFTPLLETRAQFPCLQSLQIARTPPENHNHFIVGRGYEENGQLGALLDRMPALIELWTPSAPDATFCERVGHPLRLLYMDCGYDHQDFIAQLAQSCCFSQLAHIEFSDYAQFYMPDWEASCVPFEHYEQLLSSNTLPAFSRFFLRSARLSEAQITQLKTQRPGLHFTYQNPRII
jgi:hypothetical protein